MRTRWLVLLCAFLFLAFAAPALAQNSDTYSDPDGRFTVPVPTGWTAETLANGAALLTDPDGKLKVYALVETGEDTAAAVTAAWATVAPDFTFAPQQTQTVPSSPGVDETALLTQVSADQKTVYQGVGQRVNDQVYVLLFDADIAAATQRAAQIQIIASGFKINSVDTADLSSLTALPMSAIETTFTDYVTATLAQLHVPGAAVIVVQDGKVVYAQGFGVREQGGSAPVTPDTLMMIGSTTKSMTTLMTGTLVDDGLLTWDTAASSILPTFALSDPDLSQTVTIRNLFCACTGVPRRDMELLFNNANAEQIVESLQTFRFFTPIGEAFQYSNQMVATGGYLATLAAGGTYGNLYDDYVTQMQTRVFDPIGMSHSTFSSDAVAASSDYAIPHGATLNGDYQIIPLSEESLLTPIAPAGALWSNAQDMARYVLTELGKGVSPDGKRVISEANLAETWKPQIQIDATTRYGLGWIIGSYKEVPLISHGGNTFGFTSELAFLPDQNTGIVILSNAQGANLFTGAVLSRWLELIFDQPAEYQQTLDYVLQQMSEQQAKIQKQIQPMPAAADLQPYLGSFQNDALGIITLALDGDALTLDAGEFRTRLVPMQNDQGEVVYVMADPPLAGLDLKFEEKDGQATITLDILSDQYVFMPA
jgi:CubicO group peptidase (beta-lactamase class C family)